MDSCDYVEPALFGPEEPICPYTGLRTFTEDEAIYFRGREEHVAKCLTLLAAERFVMITGASGDGKSSLAFAGLLPEVRAGFLRGRYSSWAVATFRPERRPLRNMAQALATALRLNHGAAAVETELKQGFSALVQLYQASALCPLAEPAAGLPEAEQRQQQRQAANLLVIVDQFEEFFTNPENYAGNGPNTAAQTVVNLLLETTRLAQAEKLPIYIVCTMRSDFVGQCVEFRGLIEQIGVSQYFVPRLLRHEFVEVIKEPALLSGNRISERLVQRLLYDIHYGQDQLPVLQHALRRIWLAADEGREEMDLIHYAMVGGLVADELPAADQARFMQWRAGLSAVQQQFLLASPSLRNVLDAHANQLYYESGRLYNQAFTPPLPPGTAERAIERTFRVLTRTDGQRVVRNRLTGAEITAILGDPALPWSVVCHILRPFRQAGTTFLSPFLPEGADEREVLPPDVVLDITHESLIRNWKHLREWASSEADDVRIAQDLMQQASRWQANAESSGFLLPIGSYSYFEQWNWRKQLNASWLTHYVAADDEPTTTRPRQAQAAIQHGVLQRFLDTSRRRLFIPLLVARHGLGRLAAVVVLPLLLAGIGWWALAQRRQQADYVAYALIEERLEHLLSPSISVEDKAHLLINADRLKEFKYTPWFSAGDTTAFSFTHQLDALPSDTLALAIELSIYQQVSTEHYDAVERQHPWTRRLLFDMDRRLRLAGGSAPRAAGQLLNAHQRALAVYTAHVVMAMTHHLTYTHLAAGPQVPWPAGQQALLDRRRQLLQRLLAYAQQEAATTSGPAPRPADFSFCVRVLLGQGEFRPAELRFLNNLNPLVPASAARQQFLRFFPRAQAIVANNGRTGHSGGYLTSAIMFAAQRQPDLAAQCLDSLASYGKEISDESDGGMALVPYLVKYELFTPQNIEFLLKKCAKAGGISFNELYAATVYSLLGTGPSNYSYAVNPSQQESGSTGMVNADWLNVNRVSFSLAPAQRDKTWAALRQSITDIAAHNALFYNESDPGPGQRLDSSSLKYRRNEQFLRAFLAKNHGVYLAEIRRDSVAAARSFAEFSQALAALARVCQPTEQVYLLSWDLGTAQAVGVTQAGSGAQNPVRYLQQPTRPKTQFVGAYLTCSYDAFFLYQLRREASQLTPNTQLVRLLDSVTFVEAVFPDRYAGTRSSSLQASAAMREPDNQPNLKWVRAIQNVQMLTDESRQQRNKMLYSILAALRDTALLRRLQVQRDILPFVRQHLASQPGYAQLPLGIALADLGAALAHARRGPEAWAIATALSAPLATETAIRVGEQAMLINDRSQPARLDSFLAAYLGREAQQPLRVANSIIPLLYWQGEKTSRGRGNSINGPGTATYFIQEGRPATQQTGLAYMCKGRSLADNSYQAKLDVPTYQAERRRQGYYNTILIGLAHLKVAKPNDGWREYDEKMLLKPADYSGPTN